LRRQTNGYGFAEACCRTARLGPAPRESAQTSTLPLDVGPIPPRSMRLTPAWGWSDSNRQGSARCRRAATAKEATPGTVVQAAAGTRCPAIVDCFCVHWTSALIGTAPPDALCPPFRTSITASRSPQRSMSASPVITDRARAAWASMEPRPLPGAQACLSSITVLPPAGHHRAARSEITAKRRPPHRRPSHQRETWHSPWESGPWPRPWQPPGPRHASAISRGAHSMRRWCMVGFDCSGRPHLTTDLVSRPSGSATIRHRAWSRSSRGGGRTSSGCLTLHIRLARRRPLPPQSSRPAFKAYPPGPLRRGGRS